MKDKIIEAYIKIRQNMIENYEKDLQVVIEISPKAMCKLRAEVHMILTEDFIYLIELYGGKTPVVIKQDLPENVDFIISTRRDYERREREELMKKMFRMFEN